MVGIAAALGACSPLDDDPSVPSAHDADAGDEAEAVASPERSAAPSAAPSPSEVSSPTPTPSEDRRDRNERRASNDRRADGGDREAPIAAPAGPSASRSDSQGDGDRHGGPPRYPDIRRATISGGKNALHLAIQVSEAIPRRLGRGVNMTAHFRLDMPDGSEHRITAVGDAEGWTAEVDGRRLAGFSIERDIFVFQVRRRALGGASSFRWFANTAWTGAPTGHEGDRSYYFDRVPELEAASFPE